MEADSYTMEFGWDGDDGVGMKLIRQVVRGEKTATCCPEELFEPGEFEHLEQHVGCVIPLVDKHGVAHGHVRLIEVGRTTWGDPDARLVQGEAHATAEEFRAAHLGVWDDLLASPLTSTTPLVVEYFEYVATEESKPAT